MQSRCLHRLGSNNCDILHLSSRAKLLATEQASNITIVPLLQFSSSLQFSYYRIPDNDFVGYMAGAWKRNMVWRQFGGNFDLFSSSSSHIVVERVKVEGEGDARSMQWYFGAGLSPHDLRQGLLVKVQMGASPAQLLQWWHKSKHGHG